MSNFNISLSYHSDTKDITIDSKQNPEPNNILLPEPTLKAGLDLFAQIKLPTIDKSIFSRHT